MDWIDETKLEISRLFHYILHSITLYTRMNVIKMQYRVDLLVDSLYNITTREKIENIKKRNLRCVHTQAHQNATEQTRLRVSNSHNV